jgi:hypothetical protein
MAPHTMTFVFGASSELTKRRRFKDVVRGEPIETDLRACGWLGEMGEPWKTLGGEEAKPLLYQLHDEKKFPGYKGKGWTFLLWRIVEL